MNRPTLEHYDPHSFAYISAMKRGEFEPEEDCKDESQPRLFPDTNIETLNIEVYACFTEPPDEIAEDYVLINVKDNFKNEYKSIYKGWMISSSPEVTPLEHPIYDLWLLGCSNDKTS